MTATRVVATGNVVLGALVVTRAGTTASVVGSSGGRPDPRIVRVLGARQCVQGLVTVAVPTSDVLWLGSAVDLAHAASMLPLLFTRFRCAAAISTAIALGSALAARAARVA